MKTYLLSAAAGLLVGVIYALLNVRSPAPPAIALVGLLGILAGEQLPALARNFLESAQEARKMARTHPPLTTLPPSPRPGHTPAEARQHPQQGSQNV